MYSNLLDTINSQIQSNNRTLDLMTNTFNVIQTQQQNMYLLLQQLNNAQATANSTIPINVTINDFTFTDNSSNSINPIYSNILNLLDDSSMNVINRDTIIDVSSCTTLKKYRDIVNPNNTTCAISLETFSDDDNILQINNCGHYFKEEPLRNWFRRSFRCPMCREPIISR